MLGTATARGTRRFPHQFQLDNADCGPTCLDMICRFHGQTIARERLRLLCQQDRQGSSLAGIASAAESLGFRTLAVKVSFEEMVQKAPLPCLAFFPHGHFVVVYRVKGDRVWVADPAAGNTVYTREEFEPCWMAKTGEGAWGVLLLLEASSERLRLQTAELKPNRELAALLAREVKPQLLPVTLAITVSLVAQTALPFIGASLVDSGIGPADLGFVTIALIARMVLSGSRILVEFLESALLTFVGLRIDMRLIGEFLLKLTRLPIAFFDGRQIGDLVQRIQDQKSVQEFLTNSLWQVLLSCLSLGVFGVVLCLIRPALFGLFLAGSVLYVGYAAMFLKKQRLYSHKQFHLSSRKQGLIFEFLSGMQEIKLNNAVQARRWEWEAAQHTLSHSQLWAQMMNHFLNLGCKLISEARDLAITFVVARQVVAGEMSLGTMMAVQYVVGQLAVPLSQITLLLWQAHEAGLSFQRAQQVYGLEDEEQTSGKLEPNLRGGLDFRDVTFSYTGTTARPLFSGLTLHVPEGKTTAIVGGSGSGKTTLLKLILGFYPVQGGSITVGAERLPELSLNRWRQSCGVVMQDGYIFSDTIAGNIAVGAEEVDWERVKEVARAVRIDEFVESLPLGYETRVGRDGVGISRGQAQRILIARALYRRPACLLLDEATSALDAETEGEVVDGLESQLDGTTVIVVAHRMSTVKKADQIIVLDGGEIVEKGTHEELVAAHGRYFNLVRAQLELEV